MNTLQKHRGPDDEGIFFDINCVFGHRRLSIIDLSDAGHQPFFSDDRRYVIVFNGEIYNYIEIRDELRNRGWHFSTESDTEVLLKAYQHYGTACLEKFNGMFAFVIYDLMNKKIFLARDRFGIKPLYYTINNFKLFFASEIKAFFCIPKTSFSINHQSLFDFLVFNRTDVFDETFLCEIKRIPSGYWATYDGCAFTLKQWWNAENIISNPSVFFHLESIQPKIHDTMVSAVKLRMRSDVPIGSCLSGGLDSSILIGILFNNKMADINYPVFTASFPGHPLDEIAYIDSLNSIYPFTKHIVYPNNETALSNIKQFIYANDEPTTSPSFYSQYEVMRKASECGVTVLLDGQGGDENFAGYQYFHGFNLYGLLKEKHFLAFCTELLKSISRKQHISAYQTLFFQLLPEQVKKFLLISSTTYLNSDFFYAYIDSSKIFSKFFNAENLNMSLVRHFQFKLEHLLRMEDRNSMAFSLEARTPYLDYRLVELLLRTSASLKIKNGETKHLQKNALGQYTTGIIKNRKDKIGFGTPGKDWMKTKIWKKLTVNSYSHLCQKFPDIFKGNISISEKMDIDCWKINQLAVWHDIFFN